MVDSRRQFMVETRDTPTIGVRIATRRLLHVTALPRVVGIATGRAY